ncbi:unnamed protein product, partial [Urochloa humidicola]
FSLVQLTRNRSETSPTLSLSPVVSSGDDEPRGRGRECLGGQSRARLGGQHAARLVARPARARAQAGCCSARALARGRAS